MPSPLRLGVLASGEGTTLDGLASAITGDSNSLQIQLVIADRRGVPAIERARRHGLATTLVPYDETDVEGWSRRLTDELESHRVDLVVLAGFLPILPSSWIERWRGRAINLHPSLLPRYGGRGMYGRRVHAAVLAAGDTETGATVHLVTDAIDAGPTVAQQRMAVVPGDSPESLRERLRPVEIALLVATLRRFADGSIPLPYPGGDDRARDRPAEPALRE
ncbi:MAG: phosphoribosylglycinamide formyltransferase [Thermoplasmata archaeon]